MGSFSVWHWLIVLAVVLLLFGVMLTHKLYDLDLQSEVTQFLPGAIVAIGVFTILVHTAVATPWKLGPGRPPAATTAEIGQQFLGAYLLPFEVTSLLILIAIVGAIVLARKEID